MNNKTCNSFQPTERSVARAGALQAYRRVPASSHERYYWHATPGRGSVNPFILPWTLRAMHLGRACSTWRSRMEHLVPTSAPFKSGSCLLARRSSLLPLAPRPAQARRSRRKRSPLEAPPRRLTVLSAHSARAHRSRRRVGCLACRSRRPSVRPAPPLPCSAGRRSACPAHPLFAPARSQRISRSARRLARQPGERSANSNDRAREAARDEAAAG